MSKSTPPRPICGQPKAAPRPLPPGLSGARLEAIQLTNPRWANGTILSFNFLAGVNWNWPEPQKDVVRNAFAHWKALGIGLEFREVASPEQATICIGFLQNGESWSQVGPDLLRPENKYPDGRNMNFGWDLSTDWGWATALHEIGHAIGLFHEHQSPKSGIVWDEAAVNAYYQEQYEWPPEKTFRNIISKVSAKDLTGTNWDPTSIMHYPFKAGLIAAPQYYHDFGTPENEQLSPNDIAWIRQFFSPLPAAIQVKAGNTVQLASTSGAQSGFELLPDEAREFVLKTSGPADTLIVLNEETDGGFVQVAASDDSGSAQNATIKAELKPGRRYLAQVRTNFAEAGSAVVFSFG